MIFLTATESEGGQWPRWSSTEQSFLLFVSGSVSKAGKMDKMIQLREAEWSRGCLGQRRGRIGVGEGCGGREGRGRWGGIWWVGKGEGVGEVGGL